MIAGNKLTYIEGKGTVTVRADGKLTGRFDGQRLVGAWVWRGKQFCRQVQLGSNAPRSACQTVHANDEFVRFTTTQGGRVTTYRY